MSDHTTRHSSDVKTCSKCKQEKPLSEYHQKNDSRDGHRSECKTCVAEYGRAHRAANRERYAEMSRAWLEANKDRKAETNRAWAKNNPEKVAEIEARRRARHPDRVMAWKAVSRAIESGRMRPVRELTCACGESAEQYHHPDYSRPLDVVPVCVTCHLALHKEVSDA